MNVIEVWLITKKKYSTNAFSGEGAKIWGGRFNSPGVSAVYTSNSLSLAILESLVQSNDKSILRNMALVRASIPEELVEVSSLSKLPGGWNRIPLSKTSQRWGHEWLNNSIVPVIRVPSVVVPVEYNYMINPTHTLFSRITIHEAEPLPLDKRFLQL